MCRSVANATFTGKTCAYRWSRSINIPAYKISQQRQFSQTTTKLRNSRKVSPFESVLLYIRYATRYGGKYTVGYMWIRFDYSTTTCHSAVVCWPVAHFAMPTTQHVIQPAYPHAHLAAKVKQAYNNMSLVAHLFAYELCVLLSWSLVLRMHIIVSLWYR